MVNDEAVKAAKKPGARLERRALENGNEEATLPSGVTAEFKPFLGKHVREAQRIAAGSEDPGAMMFTMIALCVLINGKPVVMEDLDEMPGKDVLALMGEFSEANF